MSEIHPSAASVETEEAPDGLLLGARREIRPGRHNRGKRGRPIYLEMKEDLTRHIQSGKWAAGFRVPSESELIASYRVSNTTARRCLDEMENEGLLHRVRGRGTFVSDLAHMVSRRQVGVIVRDLYSLSHPFVAMLLGGIERAMEGRGVNLRIHRAPSGTEPGPLGRTLLSMLRHDEAEHAFILSNFPVAALTPLLDHGIQCLGVNTFYLDERVPHVVFDYEKSLELALRTIARLGHRRIALLFWEPPMAEQGVMNSASRIDEAWAAVRKEHPTMAPRPDLHLLPPDTEHEIAGLVGALMSRPDRPTAIHCADELVGLEVLRVLRELGHEVPRDVSVTGVRLLPSSPLACVDLAVKDLGIEAGRAMLGWLEGERPPSHSRPCGEFLVRETLARPSL